MEIKSEYVTLDVSDGTKMQAWTARPVGAGKHPGLFVFQEAFGVNAHIRDVTERFAREGYVAISPELYHRTAPPGFSVSYDDYPALAPHINALNRAASEADQKAAHGWLRANIAAESPVAAAGFCMGGTAAFSTALNLPVACAVSFYGGTIAPNKRGPGLLDRVNELHGPVLLFWGGLDKNIPPEQVATVTDALRKAGKTFVNVDISDADHGFFCDARASYSAKAAAIAWPLTLAFLKTHCGQA
ncbi:MAG TPA: dienelactone hydrolase family protein [Candidatus Acidoferrum sp.]|jgi:carboxymethylenebutenolidase